MGGGNREKQNGGKVDLIYDSQQGGVFQLIQAVWLDQELAALAQVVDL